MTSTDSVRMLVCLRAFTPVNGHPPPKAPHMLRCIECRQWVLASASSLAILREHPSAVPICLPCVHEFAEEGSFDAVAFNDPTAEQQREIDA